MANSLYDRSLWEQQNRHAVHRFLGGDQCRRVALSEILDDPRHRRWCMDSDTACDICRAAHEEPIAPLQPREAAKGTLHTGLDIIQQQQIRAQDELYHYQHDLAAVAGTCIRCRAEGRARDHGFTSWSRRMDVIQQRTSSISRWRGAKHARKGWLAPYAACFWCLNPQTPRRGWRRARGKWSVSALTSYYLCAFGFVGALTDDDGYYNTSTANSTKWTPTSTGSERKRSLEEAEPRKGSVSQHIDYESIRANGCFDCVVSW
ncbi:hypothetical protein LTR33_002198 [Friedmanniomyces endolithicus]|nr:hypothetical protein LTR33_002198 [Friedmanniomyces endolithicus]